MASDATKFQQLTIVNNNNYQISEDALSPKAWSYVAPAVVQYYRL
jgi:hypothetical protein